MDSEKPGAATGAGPTGSSDRSEPRGSTVLRLEGRDVLSVLHRIGTQALEDLGAGQVRSTLFCDFRGRLLHRAAVAVSRDGAVWVMRPDAPPQELADYIDRHVFREDVRLATVDTLHVVVEAASLGVAPGTVSERDGAPDRAQVDAGFALRLEPAGTAAESEDEAARIRAGRPRHGHEVHPDFNPFEVGLAHEVHLSKGCFTGQEALMRLVTYKSVRRRLVRVSGRGLVPEMARDVTSAAEAVGRLTSTTRHEEGWIGLAVLKHQALESPALSVEGGGSIQELHSFPERRPLGLP